MRVLKEEYQELLEEFEGYYGDTGCNCSVISMPPCGWCTHPGNPLCLDNTVEAWEDPPPDLDLMTISRDVINQQR